jgi:hypothetical protein
LVRRLDDCRSRRHASVVELGVWIRLRDVETLDDLGEVIAPGARRAR